MFSHTTHAHYYYYFWQYFPGLFWIWCNVSHPAGLSLIQWGVFSPWTKSSWEKKILKLAQGGEKEKGGLFSFKEEQHVSTNQQDFCSLRLKTLESPSQGGYHLGESPSLSPSLPPTPTRAVSGCRWSLPLHWNSCHPWLQTHTASLSSCGKLPPSSAPRMQALASPAAGKRDAKAPGWMSIWRVPISQAQAPIHHVVNVVQSHYWGRREVGNSHPRGFRGYHKS